MTVSWMAVALVIAGGWCAGAERGEAATRSGREAYLRIAGEVEGNLRKEILDKWFPGAVDEGGGGFYERFGVDWAREEGEGKSVVYQSRLTWTAARAVSRVPEKGELYRSMARRGAKALREKFWDGGRGGFYWGVGGAEEKRKHTYGEAFGIYALVASHEATGEAGDLELAKKAFGWLEEHVHDRVNGGYVECVTLDGRAASGDGSPIGVRGDQKSMNTSIHVLEALTALARVWPAEGVKGRVREMYEICRDRIYSPAGYLTQFFTADWRRVAGADSFGHDVETAYLLVEAAEVLGEGEDPRVWKVARSLVDHARRWGEDEKTRGLWDSAEVGEDGAVTGGIKREKVWWVQAEYLNALLMMHERFGGETGVYWDAFVREWEFVKRYQVDAAHGGWFAVVGEDGVAVKRGKSDAWTECYHQGRAMMNVAERLRKMAER